MPTAPPVRCSVPGCHRLATKRGRCDEDQPQPWAGRPPIRERYSMSGSTMQTLKRRVMARDEGRCHLCGGEGAEELEHIVPVSQGGSPRDLANLAVAHRECHEGKSAGERLAGITKRGAKRT